MESRRSFPVLLLYSICNLVVLGAPIMTEQARYERARKRVGEIKDKGKERKIRPIMEKEGGW